MIVATRVVVICQVACVGTFVEAVGQGCIRLGRHDRHVVGKMSSGGGREGDDGSGDILDGEFGCLVIINNHDTP
jgi:hypothetical protein